MNSKLVKSLSIPSFGGIRPDFTDPPVFEVVLSLQFEPLPKLTVPEIGSFWERIRREFPKSEVKAPISQTIERYEVPQPTRVRISVSQEPAMRCWFVNKKGTELIQIQNDRFIFNWRQLDTGEAYPRYEKVRAKFRKNLRRFESYLHEHELGKLVPNQCEVSYINHIRPSANWKNLGQIHRVITLWSGRTSERFLPPPENCQFSVTYPLRSNEGEQIGRLHVSLEPRTSGRDGSEILRLVLTARGAPLKRTKGAIFEYIDFSREHNVRGFAAITTKRMHREWGRIDV